MIRRIASFSLVALLPLLAHADPGADYASHCAACHGADRLGGTGPALIPETLGRLKGIDQIIAKGRVATQMAGFEAELPPDRREAYQDAIPAGRFGSPEDVAAAVAYLASTEAGYVTGQTLHVNGGMAMI